MRLLVSVVLAETCGALRKLSTVAYSATASTADMPSTGMTTSMPQGRAARGIKHGAVRRRPNGDDRLDALILENLLEIGFSELVRPRQHVRLVGQRRDVLDDVGGRRVGDDR